MNWVLYSSKCMIIRVISMAGLIYLFSSRRLISILKVLFKKVEKKTKIRNRYNKVP